MHTKVNKDKDIFEIEGLINRSKITEIKKNNK